MNIHDLIISFPFRSCFLLDMLCGSTEIARQAKQEGAAREEGAREAGETREGEERQGREKGEGEA